jgi:hypothetical protein
LLSMFFSLFHIDSDAIYLSSFSYSHPC